VRRRGSCSFHFVVRVALADHRRPHWLDRGQQVTAIRSIRREQSRRFIRSTESPHPPVPSPSLFKSRTRPVPPIPRPSRSKSSRPRRRQSPLGCSLTERSASATAAATCSPAVVSSPIPGRWSPGAASRPRAAEGGEHHLRNAYHCRDVHLHRARHRRSGRFQRERILHHYCLNDRPFGDRDSFMALLRGPNPRRHAQLSNTPTRPCGRWDDDRLGPRRRDSRQP